MTKWISQLVLATAFLVTVPVIAQADGMLTADQMKERLEREKQQAARMKRMKDYRKQFAMKKKHIGKEHVGKPVRNVVPELDPSAAGSAVMLLAGGAMVILGRRRRSAF